MPELLRDHTTLRLGGPAHTWVAATTEADLVDAVRAADDAGEPVLVLSGGSNLLVADEGFDGTVVHVATRGLTVDEDGCDDLSYCGGILLTVAAGEVWDDVVAHACASAAGPASRRSPGSPAPPAPPRSRTSAPTARRSPRRSPACAPGTATTGPSAPSSPPNATSYRHSRFKGPTRRATSSST